MAGLVAGMSAKAILSAAGARLWQISPKVWLALGCAVALLLGVLWHRHEVKVTIAGAKAEQRADDQTVLAAATAKINASNATIAQLSTKLKDQTNAKIGNNAADAGGLKLRGPGKATCSPRFPIAASGPVAPVAKPDVAGPALPPDDLAAVPWNWLTDRAQEHDDLLAEVQAWRTWHDEVLKAWPKK